MRSHLRWQPSESAEASEPGGRATQGAREKSTRSRRIEEGGTAAREQAARQRALSFHSLWRIPRTGDARKLAAGEAASLQGTGSGSCYQTLVVPGTTQ